MGLFYGVGLTTGNPGLFVAEAIREHGRVLGVVTVKLSLAKVAATWAKAHEPVLLRDEHGVAFLATYPDWLYHTTRPLTGADEAALRDSEAYGHDTVLAPMPWTVQRSDPGGTFVLRTRIAGRARSFLAQDQPLPDYGWTLTVLTDRNEILQVRDQAWAMASLVMALLVLAGLYWRLRERATPSSAAPGASWSGAWPNAPANCRRRTPSVTRWRNLCWWVCARAI